ncbi:MAG TPA: hypothetical protein VGG37_05100, partial [Opitutaceae bacterium]
PGAARGCLWALAAALALGVAPWAARNRAVFHQWIPGKSNGCFELVLSQEQTDDGVLTESSILRGNPSLNARLTLEYGRLGERAFLAPYRDRALRIVTGDTGRYLRFCANRLLNAVALCRPTADTERVQVAVDPGTARRLVGRGLLLYFGADDSVYLWRRDEGAVQGERAALAAAGARDPDALAADWSRAQSAIRARADSAAASVRRMLLSGFPTVALLAAAALGRRRTPRIVLAAAAIYAIALLPNVLITHDLRHQAEFALPFALFAAAPLEAARRRAASRPGSAP